LNPSPQEAMPPPTRAQPALQNESDDQEAKESQKKNDLKEATEALNVALSKNDLGEAQRVAPKLEVLDPQNPAMLHLKDLLAKQANEQKNQQRFGALLDDAERELN